MTKETTFHFLLLILLFWMEISYGIYISQLVRYDRVSTISDFNERNLCITEKLLHQGYRYHKLHKTFTKFFHNSEI